MTTIATLKGYFDSGDKPTAAQFGTLVDAIANIVGGIVNLKSYDAVGNGTTDDSNAITAALTAATSAIFVPEGTYNAPSRAASTIDKKLYGMGQIKTSEGSKRAPYFSGISSRPSSLGDTSSIVTAFNGDLSKVQIAIEHRITGSATLGQPTSGYLYTPEAYPIYGYLYNESGYNHDNAGDIGRTSACFMKVAVAHYGQGDCSAYNATAFVNSTNPSSTTFRANPAGTLFNGGISAGQDGVYLNPLEILIEDNGFDVAAFGPVVNSIRTNATGAKEVLWCAFRSQSKGDQAIDAHFSGSGKARIGLDLVGTTLEADKLAIGLKAGDRIYLNCTNSSETLYPDNVVTSNDYITYSASTGIQFIQNNVVVMSLKDGAVVLNNLPTSAAGLPSKALWINSGAINITA